MRFVCVRKGPGVILGEDSSEQRGDGAFSGPEGGVGHVALLREVNASNLHEFSRRNGGSHFDFRRCGSASIG